ncbi:hypothetical protein GCM10023210_15440 [Chryseobacterium ginsengisoli]|uniref:Uncharacterized protein n=1 Tax=Chryseobacterium ginsengisoli TaxID=363853 RepID=A0ABP9M2F4_9FLAO
MVTLENINDFFNEYPIKDINCSHVILRDYEKIFDVFDNSFGYLSYLEFKSNDDSEIFLGSYPLNGAELWKCKNCGKLQFFYTESVGHFPTTLSIDVNFSKTYQSNPFAKSVTLNKEKVSYFIDTFGFDELKNPEKIEGFNGIKIIDKEDKCIFGYSDYQDKITFNIIADRKILRKIFEFEKS